MDFNSNVMKSKFPSSSIFKFDGIQLQTDQFGALSYTDSSSSKSDEEVYRFEPNKEAPDQTQIQSRSHDTEMPSPKSVDHSTASFVPSREIFATVNLTSDNIENRHQEEEAGQLAEEHRLQDERERQQRE
uniref:Uncharacterized protein n=1 Tax=Oryza brachyantha TaxID=4533 RepID=J3N1K8_ORYBR